MQATPSEVVLDVGGIGYRILIPVSTYPRLPSLGENVLLHTSHVVREMSQTLYGFLSKEERSFFEKVTGVSGIGPKLALSLVAHLSIDEMQVAISRNDVAAICQVPGIGKKTAQRLIIELRDKCGKTPLPSDFAINHKSDPQSQKVADGISALINLGYNQATAHKAITKSLSQLPESIDLSALITDALKNI